MHSERSCDTFGILLGILLVYFWVYFLETCIHGNKQKYIFTDNQYQQTYRNTNMYRQISRNPNEYQQISRMPTYIIMKFEQIPTYTNISRQIRSHISKYETDWHRSTTSNKYLNILRTIKKRQHISTNGKKCQHRSCNINKWQQI